MIPPDVASTLRLALIESQNQAQLSQRASPVAPTQRITDALSEVVPGQRIFAEIQGMQANGTYRALVGQREITLSLPFSAKAGDSLELEVAESDGKITLAFVANRTEQASKPPADSVATQLSRTAQLIGELQGNVDSPGKRAPPAPLNGNQALIQRMPETGADLAPVLKQAVTQSGVFYEAHQARWMAGQIPTAALRQEPQGRISVTPTPNPASQNALPTSVSRNILRQPHHQNIGLMLGQPVSAPMVYAESKASLLGTLTATALPSAQTESDNQPTANPAVRSGMIINVASNERVPSPSPQCEPELAPEPKPAAQDSPRFYSVTAQSPRESTLSTNNPTRQESSSPQPNLASTGLPREISGIVHQQLDGLATQTFVRQVQGQTEANNQPGAEPAARNSVIINNAASEIAPAPQSELWLEPEPAPQGSPAFHSERTQKSAQSPRESPLSPPPPTHQDNSSTQHTLASTGLPKEISGIVQQQLDGLATQNFVWQGQAWAGQMMQWEISTDPEGRSPNGEEADNRPWQTRLKLTLPQLGGIDAVIRLQPGGQVAISVNADSSSGELLLRGATEPLAQQLATAGLTLTQLQIIHEPGAK